MSKNRPTLWALLVVGLAGTAGLAITSGTYVEAADHLDPPLRTNPGGTPPGTERNADIADIYAWHTGAGATGTITTVLSFSGPNMPSADQAVPCDAGVLYEIHISNDMDMADEFTIQGRFGEDDLGNCFVRVTGAPGMMPTDELVVPVEYNGSLAVTAGTVRVHAGLHDDAFFFDLTGFRETVAMSTLRFVNDRDFFAGQNTPAIVVEFPLIVVAPANERFRVWASTSRI